MLSPVFFLADTGITGTPGNPNCGKTTLFNAFTGANLKVANWPGVTVEKKEGRANYQGQEFKLIDLPGIYSLSSYTMEETVSRECGVQKDAKSCLLSGRYGDYRDPKHFREAMKVDLHASLFYDVHHIKRQDDNPNIIHKRWHAIKVLEKDKSVTESHPLNLKEIVDNNIIHNEGDAGHIATVFQNGQSQEEDEDVRKERQDPP